MKEFSLKITNQLFPDAVSGNGKKLLGTHGEDETVTLLEWLGMADTVEKRNRTKQKM